MSTMTRVDYPTENGVEVRTMGQSLRPIKLVYELKEGEHTARMSVALTGRMFAVDVEDQNQLIPGLTRLIFDREAVQGMIGGRLERLTTDHIEYLSSEKPFSRGYMRTYSSGAVERLVSEPFMLFGVVTLGKEQFEEQRAKAEANFQSQNPQAARKGAWD
jgi:hypothetical protein